MVTGWATWYPDASLFYSGQQLGLLEAVSMVRDVILSENCHSSVSIGWEAFTIRPGSSHLDLDTTAIEVIGAVRWLAADFNTVVLQPQQPSDRSLGSKHLKTLGWNRSEKEDDANSAASHLLSYLLSSRLLPTELMVKITGKVNTES